MKEPKVIKLEDGGNQLTFKIYPFPARANVHNF